MVHVIKVYLEDSKNQKQVRRVAVSSNITTYFKLLQEKIQELFQLQNKNFDIKWKDSENDFIIMSSDGELAQALANSEDDLLRIYVNITNDANTIPKVPKTTTTSEGVQHLLVVCDSCDKDPINGDRYKCLQCRNFDLCSDCNAANKHPGHDMIKLVKPVDIPREWIFMGARKFWRSLFGRCPSGFFEQFKGKENASAKNPETPEENPKGFNGVNNVLKDFLNGDFAEAQKLFGGFIKDLSGNIHVQMEPCPFNNEGKVNVPQEKANEKTSASSDNTGNQEVKSAPANEKVEAQVQTKTTETKDKSSETPTIPEPFTKSTVPPKEIEKPENEDEICIDPIKEKSPDNESSTCAEGWTLIGDSSIQEAEPTEKVPAEPEKTVKYPDLEDLKPKTAESGDAVQTNDPKIINALIEMQAMGFTNESGWLERLLTTKHGNINEALDALYPFTQRH